MIVKRIGALCFLVSLTALLTLVGSILSGTSSVYAASNRTIFSHVYVLENTTGTNMIATFGRVTNGTLVFEGTTPIGGQGSGSSLHSQGSLQLSPDRRWLFAVDAGSNQISVLARDEDGKLTLKNVISSGGVDPVSLTVAPDHIYVVNDGDATTPANVAGFQVFSNGYVKPVAGATRPLSAANPAPGEIRVNPQGTSLIVTEKTTNVIDSYRIQRDGSLSAPTFTPATGSTPYGFAFSPTKPAVFVVSDAGVGAVTAYRLHSNVVSVADGPVADQQMAPCWVVVTRNGQYAYTANAGSGSVSGYRLSDHGTLTLLSTHSVGATSAPTEMTLSSESHFLYTLNTGTLNLSIFQVQADGNLISLPVPASIALPASSVGIAAD
jgi:6-phosphogluconolactonase